MPKIPRDISGRKLAKLLEKHGYVIAREKGSHLRLVSKIGSKEHKITIPDHDPIKIGTMNNMLGDLADHLKISKEKLISELFGKLKR